ncbi:MAG: sulfatase [Phycisphaerae bacterium]|nr:sulfatase [Phycisphaerae bacterium]
MRMTSLSIGFHTICIAMLFATAETRLCQAQAQAAERRNVLFIAVDDLRPDLGCYGAKHIHSPSIDKLARAGTVFSRAYCQQAVCSPSRTSLLTGRRPDTTKVYDLQTHFRIHLPDVVTLPQYFKQQGYHTQSMGKIFHGGLDDPQSWSVPSWFPKGQGYHKPESLKTIEETQSRLKAEGKPYKEEVVRRDEKTGTVLKIKRSGQRVRGPAWEDPDVADNDLADGMVAEKAVETLRQLKDKTFFLAVGFYKPHLPFIAPAKYFDLYPAAGVRLAANPFPPKDVPPVALHDFGELRAYSDMPKVGPVSDAKARELVRAYQAASSFTDAQIGRVLDELDRLGLRDKTIVVVWGDHGWHLGEHGIWCKHSNFEIATRVAMIISAPRQKNAGKTTAALSEFVDIYPTLCELAGLPLPQGLEGTSLVPVMNDPDRSWKKAAFSQYPRQKAMGYSIRTDRYRYTEWAEPGQEPAGVELYDHQTDPAENVNIAGLAENKELVVKLSKMLKDGWNAAKPE